MTEQTRTTVYDVLIVGAGPSGSAAAIELRKQGHSVLVIDRSPFPRDKVCGDVLTGNSVRLLDELGVWDDIAPTVNTIPAVDIFRTGSRPLTLHINFHTLKRRKLDACLLDHARAHGAAFEVLRFTGNIERQGNISICEAINARSQLVTRKANYVLLAMGCQPPHVFYGNKCLRLQKPDLVGVRGYYRADWNIDHLRVFFSDTYIQAGYIWVFPVGNEVYNVGCGTKAYQRVFLKKDLDMFLDEYCRETNTSGHWLSAPKGACLRTGLLNSRYAVVDNVVLSGEMLGSTLPMTGEGVGMALQTGMLAAKNIQNALKHKKTYLLDGYTRGVRKGLQIKYIPYRIGAAMINFKKLSFPFRSERANKIFAFLFIRLIRFGTRISLKLSP